MIIDAISDLHGFYPKLPGGDLLIIAGDLTARDIPANYLQFFIWLSAQKYKKKIIVSGNHDMLVQKNPSVMQYLDCDFEYLCDSQTCFEGLKIWGSPWTATFKGINPLCTAFTVKGENELDEKWALIPDHTDILITHSPPYGICDMTQNRHGVGYISRHCGSEGLYCQVQRLQPMLHFFGHIHEGRGKGMIDNTRCFNVTHVDENYNPKYKKVRVVLND